MRNVMGFFTMLGFLVIVGIMCVASGALGVEGVKQFDALDFSAVGTRSTAIPAAPAALEPPQAEAAPVEEVVPPVEQAAPVEAAAVPSDGQVPFTSFSAEALVVLYNPGVGLAHYSAPPASFVGGDLTPLANGQAVTIVGLARTSAERLVMLATDGQITYAPLMRDGKVVFIYATGQPVVTMEEFDKLLP